MRITQRYKKKQYGQDIKVKLKLDRGNTRAQNGDWQDMWQEKQVTY